MKKSILILALVAGLGLAANAQYYNQDKPVSFGIKAGVAFPSMTLSAVGLSNNLSSKVTFYVGGLVDIQVSDMFSVQPGLTFMNKGGKSKGSSYTFGDEESGASVEISTDEASMNISYLELPINFLAKFEAGNGKVFVGAGPYAGYALSGNNKSGDFKQDITFGSGDDDFKRFDYGVNFLAGYQLESGLNFHAGYGLGLANVANDNYDFDTKAKNKVFAIGVGFNF
jgi:hypothetical protein